jgi:hypothetical protein
MTVAGQFRAVLDSARPSGAILEFDETTTSKVLSTQETRRIDTSENTARQQKLEIYLSY